MTSLPNAHVQTPGHPLSHKRPFSGPELLTSVHQLGRLLSAGAATRARIVSDRDQPSPDVRDGDGDGDGVSLGMLHFWPNARLPTVARQLPWKVALLLLEQFCLLHPI